MQDQDPPREQPQPPPIPEPSGEPPGARRCPNCGQGIAPGASHCQRCGARLAASPPGAMSTASMVGLGCLALGFGGFGTCSLLVSVSGLFSGEALGGFFALFFALGAGASYIAILCARRIADSIRARRDRGNKV